MFGCVYNLSKVSALYNMGHFALALCGLHQFSLRLPRYVSFTQGTLASALPVEIVCFVVCHYIWSSRIPHGAWLPPNNLILPLRGHAWSVHSMFPVNIAVVYVFEDKAVPTKSKQPKPSGHGTPTQATP